MAIITDIPTELIQSILSHIQLEDLENFAQTSRILYVIAAPLLPEHRALCRKYRTFTTDRSRGFLSARLGFLKQLLDDPHNGRYVRTIELLGKLVDGDLPDQGHDLPEGDQHLLSQLAGDTGFFTNWPSFARIFAEPVLLALLIMRFPNATSLDIEAGFVGQQTAVFYDLFRAIKRHPSPALNHLSRVHLRPSTVQASSTTDIQHICALLSVKFLSAPDLSLGYRQVSVEEELATANTADLNSAITDLELWNCAASPECLFELLRSFLGLQTFKYSSANPAKVTSAKTPHFNPFIIRSGLILHSATTLRKITLLAHPNDHAPPFMGSLRVLSSQNCERHTAVLPKLLRRLVLDGQKRSILDEDSFHYDCDPVDAAVEAAICAKIARGIRQNVAIEELVFTGYEGFANEEVKEDVLGRAERVSLTVKFSAREELDQTF